jgi:hypothetical protein
MFYKRPVAHVLIVTLMIIGGTVAMAGQSGGDRGVPGLVREVLQAIADLRASQDVKIRVTPAAFASSSDVAACEIVNVTGSRAVRVELLDSGGNAVDDRSGIILPGQAVQSGTANGPELFYCKFTVLDVGTRADIRGSLVIFPAGARQSDRLSVPAE